MVMHNPENERLKRRYFTYLREAKRLDDSTLDGVSQALHRFELYTRFKDFKSFRIEQAVGFKHHLADQQSERSGQPLSKATLSRTLNALKGLFRWLAGQPGFRSRLSYSDAEYFNLSEKDARIAMAHRDTPVPTLQQIHYTLSQMPIGTDIQKRDRALIAFTLLTGARDGAIASFRLRHIDLVEGMVFQDARDVRTKFSKTFSTWFFGVDGEALAIFTDWVHFLKSERLWGGDDPLFPATRIINGKDHAFEQAGLDRRHWSNAGPIRKVFRSAFEAAGLPGFNPHSFRKTLVRLGQERCKTPEDFKIWSQNLGHEEVLTTFQSYGKVEPRRQAEVIKGLGAPPNPAAVPTEDLPRLFQKFLEEQAKRQKKKDED